MHSALFYITALLILVVSMKLVGGADVLDHYSEFIIATKVPYASTKISLNSSRKLDLSISIAKKKCIHAVRRVRSHAEIVVNAWSALNVHMSNSRHNLPKPSNESGRTPHRPNETMIFRRSNFFFV